MKIHVLLLSALLLAALGTASSAADEDAEPAPDTRFGLTESQRREVFREALRAEDRAQREAARQFTEAPESPGQVRLTEQLAEQYRDEVAARYGIDRKALTEIQAEGYMKKWPILLDRTGQSGVASKPPPEPSP